MKKSNLIDAKLADVLAESCVSHSRYPLSSCYTVHATWVIRTFTGWPTSVTEIVRSLHDSPEHTPSTQLGSLRTVVRFSYPVFLIKTTSSIRIPPTASYLFRTS